MRILSLFFFGVTTIGAHHLVASFTGVMIFCDIAADPMHTLTYPDWQMGWITGC